MRTRKLINSIPFTAGDCCTASTGWVDRQMRWSDEFNNKCRSKNPRYQCFEIVLKKIHVIFFRRRSPTTMQPFNMAQRKWRRMHSIGCWSICWVSIRNMGNGCSWSVPICWANWLRVPIWSSCKRNSHCMPYWSSGCTCEFTPIRMSASISMRTVRQKPSPKQRHTLPDCDAKLHFWQHAPANRLLNRSRSYVYSISSIIPLTWKSFLKTISFRANGSTIRSWCNGIHWFESITVWILGEQNVGEIVWPK